MSLFKKKKNVSNIITNVCENLCSKMTNKKFLIVYKAEFESQKGPMSMNQFNTMKIKELLSKEGIDITNLDDQCNKMIEIWGSEVGDKYIDNALEFGIL